MPAPCGLWRPPISWALVRDVGFYESSWSKGPNVMVAFQIEGIEPKLAGDMLYVVDHHSIRYRLRPAAMAGYWRFEGLYDVEQAKLLFRITAGLSECVTGKDGK